MMVRSFISGSAMGRIVRPRSRMDHRPDHALVPFMVASTPVPGLAGQPHGSVATHRRRWWSCLSRLDPTAPAETSVHESEHHHVSTTFEALGVSPELTLALKE